MNDSRRDLGRSGEEHAASFLEAAGYRILARNVRAGRVEIDLVCAGCDLVVFVEVKTRRSRSHGGAEEAVDRHKRARLVRGARSWLAGQRQHYARVRFDVVACEWDGGGWQIRHWPGAFDAGE